MTNYQKEILNWQKELDADLRKENSWLALAGLFWLGEGKISYGSGRYLSVAAPDNGKVIIDFNRAYNPPCAFTPYATCPLPPTHNNLQIAITGGEKNAVV